MNASAMKLRAAVLGESPVLHITLGVGLLTLALMVPAIANATCTQIKACTTITASNSYCVPVGSSIVANGGDCIAIKAPNVSLTISGSETVNGVTYAGIRGNGTGVGVHVYSNATNFSGNIGVAAYITNFNIGVEDDANGATFSVVTDDSYTPAPVTITGNIGVEFNNVHNSAWFGYVDSGAPLTVQGKQAGCLINGGANNYLTTRSLGQEIFTTSSSGDGIRLVNTVGTVVYYIGGGYGTNGIHILNSSGNLFYQSDAFSSNGQGIFIDGGGGNTVYQTSVSDNKIGIRVTNNSYGNSILNNQTSHNASYDLFQGSPNSSQFGCYGNLWTGNSFTTGNQPCIN
jgi:hypothetical protein